LTLVVRHFILPTRKGSSPLSFKNRKPKKAACHATPASSILDLKQLIYLSTINKMHSTCCRNESTATNNVSHSTSLLGPVELSSPLIPQSCTFYHKESYLHQDKFKKAHFTTRILFAPRQDSEAKRGPSSLGSERMKKCESCRVTKNREAARATEQHCVRNELIRYLFCCSFTVSVESTRSELNSDSQKK
jgi:hypothetical protein